MKSHTKKLFPLLLVIGLQNLECSDQNNQTNEPTRVINPGLAELIDRVGQRSTYLTTNILNGGDSTKTLTSISSAINKMQNIVATKINDSQNNLTTNILNFQSNLESLITNLGTSNDLSNLYNLLALNIVTEQAATPLLLNNDNPQSDLQTGQIALMQLSKNRPELTTPLTASTYAPDVAAYNTAITNLLTSITTAITSVQTNITDPTPLHLFQAQEDLFFVIFNLTLAIQALNILINEGVIATSAYSLEQINAVLTLLQARATFLQSLGLQHLVHVI
ncbi:MAG: hypothetical protein ACXWL5_03350 [Candidatus Chromulinivorax sp.]